MKKIIVIGSKGQLGNEFQELEKQYPSFQFFFYDVEEMDIVNKDLVEKGIGEVQPDYVINCAAYTAVDKAETDKELSFSINSNAVRNIALACSANDVKFIHISTDYVFDGEASEPYTEDSDVNPSNIYGLSKLKGEQEAVKGNPDVIIIRTAWVYSVYGNNFVKTMLRLMNSKPEINVVSDQYGSPTYAHDLAEVIIHIISSGKWTPGIYHFTNEGVISWFDFASEIKKLSALSCVIHPITTEQYPTPAKRPKYSVLNKSKIQQAFRVKLKDWKESLHQCLNKMPRQN
jgi:dTDP-4-dehydrorhamnose reductase